MGAGEPEDGAEDDVNDGLEALQTEFRNRIKGGMYQTLFEAFQDFDTDGDSMISKSEFKQAFEKLGVQADSAEIKEMRRGISTSSNGRISYEDLEAFMMAGEPEDGVDDAGDRLGALQTEFRNRIKGGMYQTLFEAFQDFDADGDNVISKSEFKQAFDKLGMQADPADIKEMRRGISTSGNGRISYEDLEAFMMAGEPNTG